MVNSYASFFARVPCFFFSLTCGVEVMYIRVRVKSQKSRKQAGRGRRGNQERRGGRKGS